MVSETLSHEVEPHQTRIKQINLVLDAVRNAGRPSIILKVALSALWLLALFAIVLAIYQASNQPTQFFFMLLGVATIFAGYVVLFDIEEQGTINSRRVGPLVSLCFPDSRLNGIPRLETPRITRLGIESAALAGVLERDAYANERGSDLRIDATWELDESAEEGERGMLCSMTIVWGRAGRYQLHLPESVSVREHASFIYDVLHRVKLPRAHVPLLRRLVQERKERKLRLVS